MNWVSIAIIAAIALLTWRAYRNGFVRELVSLSAIILAVPLAGVLYDDMYPKVHPIVDDENLASLVSFLAILVGVVVGGQVLAHVLKQGVAMLNLGGLDNLAGAGFGFLKGVLLCQVLLIAFVRFPEPDVRDDIEASPVATRLLDSAPVVLAILPGTFDRATDAFLEAADSMAEGLAEDVGSTPTPGNAR